MLNTGVLNQGKIPT